MRLWIVGSISFLILGFPQLLRANESSIYSAGQSRQVIYHHLPEKTAILTFDDGPSAYTDEVLNILKEKNIKASFFVIGNNAVRSRTIKRIYDEGHELGNHTLSHPDISKIPKWRRDLEINISRLVIAARTGHTTRLFRAPFLATGDAPPDQAANHLVETIAQTGYMIVGIDRDSQDWSRPGVETIVRNSTGDGTHGVVILLHDGGGDRSQTVAALPKIIDDYHARGYRFTTVSEALGYSRDYVMPPQFGADVFLAPLALGVMQAVVMSGTIFYWLTITFFLMVVIQIVFVVSSAIIQARRKSNLPLSDVPCTVIVPAYNEAEVIVSAVTSLLQSNHKAFRVIVVDDGSKDNTFTLVSTIRDKRLRVYHKVNGGKSSALNYGIRKARTPIIVAVDADTVFDRDTLRLLCRHFSNPKVGAVSGNARVANVDRLLTKLQSVEYITGFNTERRMSDLFDCITVVPGAIGAFRRSVLQEIGGFSIDTLAEDTDLTLSIKERGYKIIYDHQAKAYTEAPTTLSDLLKQRFRWTFGTMQSLWKHRKSFLNPKKGTLGLIGLPYMVFYHIIFPLAGPFFDAALVIGLILHRYDILGVSAVFYVCIDLILAGVALKLEGEKLWQLWLIVPQRFLYRQILYYVMLRSVLNVLAGRLVRWNKVKREGRSLSHV